MIPLFQSDGLLPPGDYEISFAELRQSILAVGNPGTIGQGTWDTAWRTLLIDNLEVLTNQLWQVGVRDIYVDGYFVCDLKNLASGALTQKLNLLDPYKIWTWDPRSRKPYRGYPKKQLPMWHRYRVELYPHVLGLGISSGIRDKHGNELEFPSAFRQSRRDGRPRGIVKIKHETGGTP